MRRPVHPGRPGRACGEGKHEGGWRVLPRPAVASRRKAGSQAAAAPPCGSCGAAGGWRSPCTLPASSVLASSCSHLLCSLQPSLLCPPHPAAPKCQPCFLASTKTHLPWGLGSLEDRGGVLGGLCAPHLSLSSLSFSEVRGSVCSPPSLPHILGTAILVTPEHS